MAKRKNLSARAVIDSPGRFYNGCVGKKRHPSKRVAQSVVDKLNEPHLRAYKCKFCHSWHLGHDR